MEGSACTHSSPCSDTRFILPSACRYMSHYGPHPGRAPAFGPGAAPLPQQQGAIGGPTRPAPAVRAVPYAQVRSGSRVHQTGRVGDMLAVAHVLHGL